MSSERENEAIIAQHREGAIAFENGVPRENCPYKNNLSTQAIRWRRGWSNAAAGLKLNKSV